MSFPILVAAVLVAATLLMHATDLAVLCGSFSFESCISSIIMSPPEIDHHQGTHNRGWHPPFSCKVSILLARIDGGAIVRI
jgi:hypothetical protein